MSRENAVDSQLIKQAVDHFVVLRRKAATAAQSIGGEQRLVLKIYLTCYASVAQQHLEKTYPQLSNSFNSYSF